MEYMEREEWQGKLRTMIPKLKEIGIIDLVWYNNGYKEVLITPCLDAIEVDEVHLIENGITYYGLDEVEKVIEFITSKIPLAYIVSLETIPKEGENN